MSISGEFDSHDASPTGGTDDTLRQHRSRRGSGLPPRILLAQAGAVFRGWLSMILRGALASATGCEVVTVGDGQAALERLQCDRIDLVVSGGPMPRVDGLELCRRMAEEPGSPPIIVCARMDWNPILEVLQAGAVKVISLPCSESRFGSIVRQMMAMLSHLRGLNRGDAGVSGHQSIWRHRRPRMLVVEEDPDVLWLQARILSRRGIDCETAADGLTALRLVQEREYDLVLSDGRMPGLDGLELTCLLAARQDAPPILVSSGWPGDMEQRVLEAGAIAFLSKPYDVWELIRHVELTLGMRPATSLTDGRPR